MHDSPVSWDGIYVIIMGMNIYPSASRNKACLLTCHLYVHIKISTENLLQLVKQNADKFKKQNLWKVAGCISQRWMQSVAISAKLICSMYELLLCILMDLGCKSYFAHSIG